MNKEDVAHIYDGILLNQRKNGTGLCVETWMVLEFLIQSEVAQEEKNILSIHTYGI